MTHKFQLQDLFSIPGTNGREVATNPETGEPMITNTKALIGYKPRIKTHLAKAPVTGYAPMNVHFYDPMLPREEGGDRSIFDPRNFESMKGVNQTNPSHVSERNRIKHKGQSVNAHLMNHAVSTNHTNGGFALGTMIGLEYKQNIFTNGKQIATPHIDPMKAQEHKLNGPIINFEHLTRVGTCRSSQGADHQQQSTLFRHSKLVGGLVTDNLIDNGVGSHANPHSAIFPKAQMFQHQEMLVQKPDTDIIRTKRMGSTIVAEGSGNLNKAANCHPSRFGRHQTQIENKDMKRAMVGTIKDQKDFVNRLDILGRGSLASQQAHDSFHHETRADSINFQRNPEVSARTIMDANNIHHQTNQFNVLGRGSLEAQQAGDTFNHETRADSINFQRNPDVSARTIMNVNNIHHQTNQLGMLGRGSLQSQQTGDSFNHDTRAQSINFQRNPETSHQTILEANHIHHRSNQLDMLGRGSQISQNTGDAFNHDTRAQSINFQRNPDVAERTIMDVNNIHHQTNHLHLLGRGSLKSQEANDMFAHDTRAQSINFQRNPAVSAQTVMDTNGIQHQTNELNMLGRGSLQSQQLNDSFAHDTRAQSTNFQRNPLVSGNTVMDMNSIHHQGNQLNVLGRGSAGSQLLGDGFSHDTRAQSVNFQRNPEVSKKTVMDMNSIFHQPNQLDVLGRGSLGSQFAADAFNHDSRAQSINFQRNAQVSGQTVMNTNAINHWTNQSSGFTEPVGHVAPFRHTFNMGKRGREQDDMMRDTPYAKDMIGNLIVPKVNKRPRSDGINSKTGETTQLPPHAIGFLKADDNLFGKRFVGRVARKVRDGMVSQCANRDGPVRGDQGGSQVAVNLARQVQDSIAPHLTSETRQNDKFAKRMGGFAMQNVAITPKGTFQPQTTAHDRASISMKKDALVIKKNEIERDGELKTQSFAQPGGQDSRTSQGSNLFSKFKRQVGRNGLLVRDNYSAIQKGNIN